MSNIQVEIGPGDLKLNGFITVSDKPAEEVDADYNNIQWGTDRLPFPDESVDLVYASHVLEHIFWYKAEDAFREVHRILKPNGKLEIWVPDFRYIVGCYLNDECGDDWRYANSHNKYMKWINGRIFAYGDFSNLHKSCWDMESLMDLFRTTDFSYVHLLGRPRATDHGKINLGVGGFK